MEFWEPPNITGTVKARIFKFFRDAWQRVLTRKCKIGSKGFTLVSRDPLFGILGHPNISGTVKARNFKFGTELRVREY